MDLTEGSLVVTAFATLLLAVATIYLFISTFNQLRLARKEYNHHLKENSEQDEIRILRLTLEKLDQVRAVMEPIDRYLNEIKHVAMQDSHLQEFERFTGQLGVLERFSAGVNMDVYDLKVTNICSGGYLIDLFVQLEAFIAYRRSRLKRPAMYVEFERMIKDIRKDREKNRVSHHRELTARDIKVNNYYRRDRNKRIDERLKKRGSYDEPIEGDTDLE